MEDISNKILSEIKAHHLKPVPRWHFWLKNYILWAAFGISVIIGGVSFSAAMHFMSRHDWDVYLYTGENYWGFLFSSLPYFWIILILLFLALAYYDYLCTKGAYKYRGSAILFGSLIMSAMSGAIFYYSSVGGRTDRMLNKYIPGYQSSVESAERIWYRPESGLLAGEVIRNADLEPFEEAMLVRDCKGTIWKVTRSAEDRDNGEERKKIRKVKIVGEKEGCENCFKAKEIREWEDDDEEEIEK